MLGLLVQLEHVAKDKLFMYEHTSIADHQPITSLKYDVICACT